MKNQFVGDLLITTTHKGMAKLLASLFAAEPNDDKTFDYAAKLRPIGTTDPFTHLGGVIKVRATLAAAITEYVSDGPYPNLNTAGLTNQDIADFKSVIKMRLVPSGAAFTEWPQWLISQGLEIVPPGE